MTRTELEKLAEDLNKITFIAKEFGCSVNYDIDAKRVNFDGEIGNEIALIERLEEMGLI